MPPVPSKKLTGSLQAWASITSLILPLQAAYPWESLRTTFTQPLGSLASWQMSGWRASPLALVRHVDSRWRPHACAGLGGVGLPGAGMHRGRPPALVSFYPRCPAVAALAGLTLVCALRCITSCRPACTPGRIASPWLESTTCTRAWTKSRITHSHHHCCQPPPLLQPKHLWHQL